MPGIEWTRSVDPTTGNVSMTESEALVKCAPDAATFPATSTSCTSFAPTGVTLHRTIVQNHGGRQATVSDNFVSTNGASHAINLSYEQDFENSTAGYRFPWVDGATYNQHVNGDTVAPPPSSPSTAYMSWNNTLPDGDVSGAQGAITFSTAPSAINFLGGDEFLASFARTVPASGSLSIVQTFSWAFTKADVGALARQAEDADQAPNVAITSPATGTVVSQPQIAVSGTATDNGGTPSLTVNGASVPVGAGGAWSTTVTGLHPGANTITAIGRDAQGNTSQAQISVTYSPQAGPTVSTTAATGVSTNAATLPGTVNPQGAATTYRFEYGTTTRYGRPHLDPLGGVGSRGGG